MFSFAGEVNRVCAITFADVRDQDCQPPGLLSSARHPDRIRSSPTFLQHVARTPQKLTFPSSSRPFALDSDGNQTAPLLKPHQLPQGTGPLNVRAATTALWPSSHHCSYVDGLPAGGPVAIFSAGRSLRSENECGPCWDYLPFVFLLFPWKWLSVNYLIAQIT